jgi:hypothetical protein
MGAARGSPLPESEKRWRYIKGMHTGVLWLALAAAPFWETRSPQDWTEDELIRILHDSPWAQIEDGVQVFLASARPLQEAEREVARRRKQKPGNESANLEYAEFLRENQGKHLVLAVAYPNWNAISDAGEAAKMEQESILKVGKKKYKMIGHFPPTPSDPYLRLIYPRSIAPGDKTLAFELYLPGINPPFRLLEFRVKDLVYRGSPEM